MSDGHRSGRSTDRVAEYYYFLAHQHKATGRKTRLDIQNYGRNGNLLCYHVVVERNRISSLQSHYYYYAAFNAPCVGHKDDESQARVYIVDFR